ncbi:hypothetical protein OFO30_36865, partial [Escherichia coli]|nr:hypothetical protein [Escherichia coli]
YLSLKTTECAYKKLPGNQYQLPEQQRKNKRSVPAYAKLRRFYSCAYEITMCRLTTAAAAWQD